MLRCFENLLVRFKLRLADTSVTGSWAGWTPDETTGLRYYRTTIVDPRYDEPLLVLPTVRPLLERCYSLTPVDPINGTIVLGHVFETCPIAQLADDGCPNLD